MGLLSAAGVRVPRGFVGKKSVKKFEEIWVVFWKEKQRFF
jgi:hypothetical protein